jgi:hypothetical protein
VHVCCLKDSSWLVSTMLADEKVPALSQGRVRPTVAKKVIVQYSRSLESCIARVLCTMLVPGKLLILCTSCPCCTPPPGMAQLLSHPDSCKQYINLMLARLEAAG